MDSGAAPPRPGLWKRPGIRRLTYALAAGAALAGLFSWTVRRPFVTAWALGELDRWVRAETGLPLQVKDLELSLLSGRVVLRGVAWGGDFVQVERLELLADPWSLVGSRPHVRSLRIVGPRVLLRRAALEKVRLRPRPPSATPVKVLLDSFTLEGGRIEVDEPSWGLPRTTVEFRATAKGLGPNHVAASLQAARIQLGAGEARLEGRAALDANVSESVLGLTKAELDLGRSRLRAFGTAGFKDRALGGTVAIDADLAQVATMLGTTGLGGEATLTATLAGRTDQPSTDLQVAATDLTLPGVRLQPGHLKARLRGGTTQVHLAGLDWESPEGRLHAEGDWRKGGIARLRLAAQDLDLGASTATLRAGFLKELRASFQGEASLPWDPARPSRLDKASFQAQFDFTRHGEPAGRAVAKLAEGDLDLPELNLKTPELDLVGKGKARLGPKGLLGLQGGGRVRTDAQQVAKVLKAWEIVDLDMAGRTEAQASLSWDPSQGLRLDGSGEVAAPRWQKAQADRVRADVRIRGSELWVDNTELQKGDGRGWGQLWLDWGKVRPGADTLDLCYRGFRLPVAEGLRAADDGRNGIAELPIAGLGGGWVRIRGDWEHLRLTGEGLLEEGRVYGLRLPAGRATVDFDLSGGRLRVTDFRVADSTAQLGDEAGNPEGFLALKGALDMDLTGEKWTGRIAGRLDSTVLELPGPRFQASMEGGLEGPWISPFGPMNLPSGWLTFGQGRLLVGDQSVDDLRGFLRLRDGLLTAEVGSAGFHQPILSLQALGLEGRAEGGAALRIAAETGETKRLAPRLTGDLLLDAAADLRADGVLDAKGFRWRGQVQEFAGYFPGFTLAQEQAGGLSGDASSVTLDLSLQGRAAVAPARPAPEAARKPEVADAEPPRQAGTPARFQLSGTLPFSLANPANLRLRGSGELANLKTILDHLLDLENAPGLLADLQPEGRATVDLRGTGTYEDPRVDGSLDLVGGRLRLKNYAQSIEDVIFTLRFQGREILLSEEDPLIGTLAQGALGLWGKAVWGLGGLASYDFSARLEEFLVRDLPQGFELQGELEANLSGNDKAGGVVRGTLRAERAAYHADVSLNDLILGGSLRSAPELSGLDPDDPLSRIDLDLDLVLAQPWEFDTNLLWFKGRPEGAFKVLGTLARPGLKGRMEFLPGGRITNLLPAGDVVLERGSILFIDPTSVNPLLNLEGRIDVPPYLVSLAIHGTLDRLNFVPTSTPSLRQDEIVAILIDPTAAPTIGTASSGGSQAALNYGLASASSGLFTTLAFANFGETLRKTLKLDRVNPVVRTGTTGTLESSLTIGKTFEIFGSRTPIIGTYSRAGNLVTLSGQVEWRFGNFVMQFGLSSSSDANLNPTGEIRHTWSPR